MQTEIDSSELTLLRHTEMMTSVMSDVVVMPTVPDAVLAEMAVQIEAEFVKCDCCGLTEECTPAYIETIRERYQGKWICGLCAEATKDEIVRSERLISTEEAMARHMSFCKKFESSGPPPNPAIHLISAMRQILRRSLESPRMLRSMPSSPVRATEQDGMRTGIGRSGSCIPSLSFVIDSGSFDELDDIVSK